MAAQPNTGIQYAVETMPEPHRNRFYSVTGYMTGEGMYSDAAALKIIDAINNQSGQQYKDTINDICQEARDQRDNAATDRIVSRFSDHQREQFDQARADFEEQHLWTAAHGLKIAGIIRDDNAMRASHRIEDLAHEASANERNDGLAHRDAEPKQVTDQRDREPLALTDERITTQARRAGHEITGHYREHDDGLSL